MLVPRGWGARSQIMDIAGKLLSGSSLWGYLPVLTEAAVVFKSVPLRFDGIGGQVEIPLHCEPTPGMLLLCNERLAFPTDVCHGQLLPMRKEQMFFLSLL